MEFFHSSVLLHSVVAKHELCGAFVFIVIAYFIALWTFLTCCIYSTQYTSTVLGLNIPMNI